MGAPAVSMRFVLHLAGAELLLRPGESYLIGRSTECKIVLDDQMVSRRHARLIVGVTVLIEDLGSANGVYVDGRRIQTIRRLSAGQRIQIGGQELFLATAQYLERARMPTRAGTPSPQSNTRPRAPLPNRQAAPGATDRVHFPEVLLELSGRLITQQRADEAEKLLADFLHDVVNGWRKGEAHDENLSERCAERALGLAAATGKSSWLDYVFDLYAAMDRLLPETLINESYRVVRVVRRPSIAPIRSYVRRLEARQNSFSPSERFLLKRLHGLEHMASAR